MTTTTDRHRASERRTSGGAMGVLVFAAVIMIMGGVFHAVQGLVALANDTFFVMGEEYVFEFDITGWGWAHLLLGIVVALAGIALFQGSMWARVVAVIVACVSALANFLWLPYYPVWSLVVITFDVFVIWAVTTHGRELATDY